jgi:hypothetical protein
MLFLEFPTFRVYIVKTTDKDNSGLKLFSVKLKWQIAYNNVGNCLMEMIYVCGENYEQCQKVE